MFRITLKPISPVRTVLLLCMSAFMLAACNSTPTPQPPTTPTSVTSVATSTPLTAPTQGQPTVASTLAATGTATAAAILPTETAVSATTQATPGTQGTETPISSSEQPVAPEQNPVGDISDNQAFVDYTSTHGSYSLQVPEGWARTENGPDVSFVDKLDGVKVSITNATIAPTAKSAPGNEVAALQKSGRAVQVTAVNDVQLPAVGGPTGTPPIPAVLVEYTSNSDPNPVTGKQVRLENNSYLFFNKGKLATLTLWAPLGADNVDQWQLIAKSFTWK